MGGATHVSEKRLQHGKQAHKQRRLQKTRKQIHQSSGMAKPQTQDSTQWSQVGNLSTKSRAWGGGRERRALELKVSSFENTLFATQKKRHPDGAAVATLACEK